MSASAMNGLDTLSRPAVPPPATAATERPLGATQYLSGDFPAPGPDTEPVGSGKITFADFLSVINPLQHIPIVSTIYRAITGDTIEPTARVIGGALFGGPAGLVVAAFSSVFEQTTGKDIGAQALALLSPGSRNEVPEETAPPQIAASATVPAAAARAAETARPQAAVAGLDARRGNADANGPAGRPLTFYQANAGTRLPTIDNSRSGGAPSGNAPPVAARTQPPLPLFAADRARASTPHPARPEVAAPTPAADALRAAATTAPPAPPTNGQTAPVPPAGPPSTWFTAAMLSGLDRYRAAKQLETPVPQVDLAR
ncbi:MAG: hypothetical protein HY057_05090 [Rhodospirillales bacterium]|nr:hypothetical protein [Rhodospirillales bacterium]